MRFGFTLPLFEDRSLADPYAHTFELARTAEELGFDFTTIGHHSFTPSSEEFAAPLVFLAALAARTSRLRLATGIYLLPLHHPLAIAEQLATLDRISGGRAVLGVGVGYRPYEFAGFGAPYDRRGARLEEALEILRGAWTNKRFHYEGRHFSSPELEVTPRPVQTPHPPLWVGAVARRAVDRAARLGDGWISDLMQTLPVEQKLTEFYRTRCRQNKRPAFVCIMRNAWVAPTRAQVERQWLPGALRYQLEYWRAGARGRDDEGLFQKLEAGDRVDLATFARDRAIAGTPEDCVTEIERWRAATACDALLLSLSGPGDYETTRRTLELFGKEVIPAFS